MEYIKKNWKWIVSIILVLTFLFGYLRYKKINIFEERSFKVVEFETTNNIYNITKQDYYDEVVKVGLRELGIDSSTVVIKPITQQAKDNFDSNTELKAHILPNGNTTESFVIWIDEVSKSESIGILSHELIHLLQYQTKQIEIVKDGVIWEGKKYSYEEFQNMEYRERPWEVDAFNKQRELQIKMEKVLYE